MLEQTLTDVYTKFKVHFYQEIFKRIELRDTSLSTMEVFCVETIYALENPTIAEFANFIHVSSPNAAYKVASLIKKGYVNKIQSKKDKREYHLHVTQKYFDYYNLSQDYVSLVARRAEEQISKDDLEVFERVLKQIGDYMMPEMSDIPAVDLERSRPRSAMPQN
ncbi:MAG: MarR family transcriptional regulator [Lachnospiraceae bacterium]|nr:MarR family transcriptional regulator [Lachnospiraceae bacterium]